MSEPSKDLPLDTPAKVKKPRSPAQIEAFKKGLETLRIKREAIKKEKEKMTEQQLKEKEEEKKQQYLKKRMEMKTKYSPPVPEYVSKNDLEIFKKDLIEIVNRQTPPKTVYQEVRVPHVVEKIVPQALEVPVEKVKEVMVSGSSLLDKIFFNK